MANLTAKRMQEMEEEMNRFEEEILSTKAAEAEAAAAAAANGARNNAKKMIIGAGTFNQVQARISGKEPNSPSIPAPRPPEEKKPRVDLPVAGPLLPPPPPPPLDSQSSSVSRPSNSTMFNLRPPPPPPPFVPHQLQHRPMLPPRPPFPPRGMPPGPPCPPGMQVGNMPRLPGMMPPPPPHPSLLQRPPMPPNSFMQHAMMQMNMGNNVPPFNFNQHMMQSNSNAPTTTSTSTQSSAVVEKPKVVYAAAPVKRIITENTSKPEIIATPVVVEKPSEPKRPRLEPVVKKQVLPGIELNVPVEEIEAEKKLHFQAPVVPPPAPAEAEHSESTSQEASKKKEKKKKFVRMAAGTVWEDQTLSEWDQDDFRLFCGDLGNEVMDETLARAFSKYPSFVKAKVVRDKRTSKTKGFGFVSFKDPNDFMKAMREMNGKYVGNRPIKLRKSTWRDRQIDVVKKKEKEKKKLGFR